MRDREPRDNEYWDANRVRLYMAEWLIERMEDEDRPSAERPRRQSEPARASA